MRTTLSTTPQTTGLDTSIHNAVRSFFDMYSVESCQNEIWNLLQTYTSIPDDELPNPDQKANTVFFCRSIEKLIRQLNDVWEESSRKL
ncbi:MAG: hypothetical protein WCF67_20830 [Chitinophagaceae bacterium]